MTCLLKIRLYIDFRGYFDFYNFNPMGVKVLPTSELKCMLALYIFVIELFYELLSFQVWVRVLWGGASALPGLVAAVVKQGLLTPTESSRKYPIAWLVACPLPCYISR